jgi:hypothetical protein
MGRGRIAAVAVVLATAPFNIAATGRGHEEAQMKTPRARFYGTSERPRAVLPAARF